MKIFIFLRMVTVLRVYRCILHGHLFFRYQKILQHIFLLYTCAQTYMYIPFKHSLFSPKRTENLQLQMFLFVNIYSHVRLQVHFHTHSTVKKIYSELHVISQYITLSNIFYALIPVQLDKNCLNIK